MQWKLRRTSSPMPSAPLPDFDDDMGSVLSAGMSVDDHHTSSPHPTAGSSFHASEDSADDNDCSEFTDDEENPSGSGERKHPTDQEKYIAFEQNLEGLFKRCQECGEVIVEVNKRTNGSLLTVKATFMAGYDMVWISQPIVGRGLSTAGCGRWLLSAAILLSGSLFSTFLTFASLLNLAFISERTLHYTQKQLLCPVVHHT